MKNLQHFSTSTFRLFLFKKSQTEPVLNTKEKNPHFASAVDFKKALNQQGQETQQELSDFQKEAEWSFHFPETVQDKLSEEGIDGSFEKIPGTWFLENLTKAELATTFLEDLGDNKYRVDFHGSTSAYQAIGLGDLTQFNLEYIRVSDNINEPFQIGKRYQRPDGKIGFSNGQGYLAIGESSIIDTTKVQEPEVLAQNNQGTFEKINPIAWGSNEEEKEAQKEWRESKKGEEIKNLTQEKRSQKILQGNIDLKEIDLENVSKEAYIKGAKKIALIIEKEFGIPWQVTVAQSALESRWGKSLKGNSYFGIKSHQWGGETQKFSSAEVYNGEKVQEVSSFRKYNSTLESFVNYGEFLNNNPRYSEAFNFKNNPQKFIKEVAKAGYATDPNYSSKITAIMEELGRHK